MVMVLIEYKAISGTFSTQFLQGILLGYAAGVENSTGSQYIIV